MGAPCAGSRRKLRRDLRTRSGLGISNETGSRYEQSLEAWRADVCKPDALICGECAFRHSASVRLDQNSVAGLAMRARPYPLCMTRFFSIHRIASMWVPIRSLGRLAVSDSVSPVTDCNTQKR